MENVNTELKEKGISDEAIAKLQPIILLSGTNAEKLATLKSVLAARKDGRGNKRNENCRREVFERQVSRSNAGKEFRIEESK